MRQKYFYTGKSAIAILALAACAWMGCEQAPVTCQVGRGEFGATFKKKSGDDDCYKDVFGAFAKGDRIGFQTYFHDKGNGRPNYEDAIFGVRTDGIGELIATAGLYGVVDENEDHQSTSLGDFDDAFPDSNDICTVGEVNPTEVTLGEVTEIIEIPDTDTTDTDTEIDTEIQVVQPAVDRKLEWKDIEVLVSTAYTGTQVKATLKYEDNAEGACSAEYEVWAVMPSIECTKMKEAEDEEGNPILVPDLDDDGNRKPDDNLCGAGLINPDFPAKCECVDSANVCLCVLEEAPPAFK